MISLSSSTLFYVLFLKGCFFFLGYVLYLYLLYVSSVLFVALLILNMAVLTFINIILYNFLLPYTF